MYFQIKKSQGKIRRKRYLMHTYFQPTKSTLGCKMGSKHRKE